MLGCAGAALDTTRPEGPHAVGVAGPDYDLAWVQHLPLKHPVALQASQTLLRCHLPPLHSARLLAGLGAPLPPVVAHAAPPAPLTPPGGTGPGRVGAHAAGHRASGGRGGGSTPRPCTLHGPGEAILHL